MIRKQLFCIISSIVDPDPARIGLLGPDLEAALQGNEHIHFASLALLPPHPEDEQGMSSLMFELAIDHGVEPHRVLADLVNNQRGFDALSALYEDAWQTAARPGWQTRQEWLQAFLVKHIHLASGGFVGARDRDRRQIGREARLFEAAQEELMRAVGPEDTSATLADRLTVWVRGEARFKDLLDPAPRSKWRRPMTSPARLARLALAFWPRTIIGAVAAIEVLATVGVVAIFLLRSLLGPVFGPDSPLFGSYGRELEPVVGEVWVAFILLSILGLVMRTVVKAVTVELAMILTIGSAVVLVALLLPVTRDSDHWLSHWIALLMLAGWGTIIALVAALALAVLAALLVGALVATPPYLGTRGVVVAFCALLSSALVALHFGLGLLLDFGRARHWLAFESLGQPLFLGVPAIDAVALLPFALLLAATGIALSLSAMKPWTNTLLDWLDEPRSLVEIERAQQVHPSIDECEARLAGKINHLISLVDIKRPRGWNGLVLRFWLRLVTFVGHCLFVEGRLGRAEGILFAHWHVVDRGRRLLFCANYVGSFGGYLEEFIAGGSQGANIFWRRTRLLPRRAAATGQPDVAHGREFPPTRLGIFAGCRNEQWFKAYARDSMVPHLFRFEAYPYSFQDIERATRLRDALAGDRSVAKNDQIMRALES